MSTLAVSDLVQTCSASPSQWEGKTGDRPVYIRYRWGYLAVHVGDPSGDVGNAIDHDEGYGKQIGDDLEGVIAIEDVCAHANIRIVKR